MGRFCVWLFVVQLAPNGSGHHWTSTYGSDVFWSGSNPECRWEHSPAFYFILLLTTESGFGSLHGGSLWRRTHRRAVTASAPSENTPTSLFLCASYYIHLKPQSTMQLKNDGVNICPSLILCFPNANNSTLPEFIIFELSTWKDSCYWRIWWVLFSF